jgi:Ca2+/Na+ antiporter
MHSTMEDSTVSKADYSGFWEGMTCLTCYVFSCLFIMPNMHAHDKKYNFDAAFGTEGILFGFAGAIAGLLVYRIIRNRPNWLKLTVILVMYACILFQLISHAERFTVHR